MLIALSALVWALIFACSSFESVKRTLDYIRNKLCALQKSDEFTDIRSASDSLQIKPIEEMEETPFEENPERA